MRTLHFARFNCKSFEVESDWTPFTLRDPLDDTENNLRVGKVEGSGVIMMKNEDGDNYALFYGEVEARHRILTILGEEIDLGLEDHFSLVVLSLTGYLLYGDETALGEDKVYHIPFDPKMPGGVVIVNDYNEELEFDFGGENAVLAEGEWKLLASPEFDLPPRGDRPPNLFNPEGVTKTFAINRTHGGDDYRLLSSGSVAVYATRFSVVSCRAFSGVMFHEDHEDSRFFFIASDIFAPLQTDLVTETSDIDEDNLGAYIDSGVGNIIGFYWTYYTPYFNSKLTSWN